VNLVEASTERTTAATDALLALAAIAAIVAIRRRTDPSFARAVWLSALGATAAASALGAAAHGLALRDAVRDLLWQPLYLLLGVTMALFVVGAVRDWRGERAGRRALLPMLGLALGFYGVTRAAGGSFLAFVIYEAAALLFALAVYLTLARTGRRAGALAMVAALAVSLGAGVVQAAGLGPVRLVWTFDHNGLFHLVQLGGVALLALGLRRLLASPVPEKSPG
jgi:MYXO-CTERM domain-containing protein